MSAVVTASQIANLLAADVHDGTLKAGEMYQSERELCARFGVGRGTIRESMTILQGMSLADHSKGKRPRVVAPQLGQLMNGVSGAAQFFFMGSEGKAHLEQARLFLETSLLRYAVEHATYAQIARMVEAIEACDAGLDDVEVFRLADVSFHRALAEVPGNPIFVALHETFLERMMENRPVLEDIGVRNRASNTDHKGIMSALLAKDEEKAVTILNSHLRRNFSTNFHEMLNRRTA